MTTSHTTFIAAVAALSSHLLAQATVDTTLATNLTCRAGIGVMAPAVRTTPIGPARDTAVQFNGPDGFARAAIDFTQTNTGDERAVSIRAQMIRRSTNGGFAGVDPFEALVNFQVTEAFVGEFAIESSGTGLILSTVTVDAFDDGTTDFEPRPGAANPWRRIQSLQPGTVSFRVRFDALLPSGSLDELGTRDLNISVRRYDGCDVSFVDRGCDDNLNDGFSVTRKLDGSYSATYAPSIALSSTARPFIVLGFSELSIPVPQALSASNAPCILVPSPEIARIGAFPMLPQIQLPAPPPFAPVEVFLQAGQLDPAVGILLESAYRVGCL